MYSLRVNGDGSITFLGDAEGNNRDGIIYNRRVYSVAGSTKIRKYRTGTEIGLQGAVIGLYPVVIVIWFPSLSNNGSPSSLYNPITAPCKPISVPVLYFLIFALPATEYTPIQQE